MILVCTEGLSPSQVDEIRDVLTRRGLSSDVGESHGRTLLTVRDEPGALEDLSIDRIPGVQTVIRTGSPYPLAARGDRAPTVVSLGESRIGDGSFTVIAGPCSVEDRKQILETAALVKDAGGNGLRGGAFKPRTSPYSFRGLEDEGLALLAEAREVTGLPIVTELLDPRDLERVAATADVLQIGSRNMTNAALLREAATADKPILLKRGMSSTLSEFMLAAETVLGAGATEVILCERGIRSFDPAMRNVLDLNAVPALREMTHLPILIDPSHGAGRVSLVPSLALAAAAVGADGILIEVHPRPEMSRSDGSQALTPDRLPSLVARCRAVAEIAREETPS